jgi:hypothetical protein
MFLLRSHAEWRHDFVNYALGGGNLVFLLIGFQLHSRTGWLLTLSAIGLTSFLAWLGNLKRYRLVADTPTSRIVSAPQGFVEIVGRGKQLPGDGLVSHITGLPCLWYRYLIERKRGDRWEYVDSDVSHDTFGVDDGSGHVLVDPEGAEIKTARKSVITEGGYRKTEWTLIEGETIYVLGEHVTLGGPNAVLDKQADLASLLAEWKKDKSKLLARFDANRDGEIDLDEWERARLEASNEIDRMHLDIRMKDGIHLIRKPGHGRPYLIANREVKILVRHYSVWSWLHLLLMCSALAGLIANQQMTF